MFWMHEWVGTGLIIVRVLNNKTIQQIMYCHYNISNLVFEAGGGWLLPPQEQSHTLLLVSVASLRQDYFISLLTPVSTVHVEISVSC